MDRTVILGSLIVVGFAVSGNAADQAHDFQGFKRIEAGAGVNVDVTVGGDYAVVSEARRESTLQRLVIRREGDTLKIGRDGARGFTWGLAHMIWRGSEQVTVSVTLPELSAVAAKAGSDVEVTGEVAGDLVGRVSSGADLDIAGIDGGTLTLTASSGADLDISGTCEALTMKATSGSDIDGEDLVCGSVVARASSGADVEITALQRIIAHASSGGDIRVSGAPEQREVRHSSGGEVSLTH